MIHRHLAYGRALDNDGHDSPHTMLHKMLNAFHWQFDFRVTLARPWSRGNAFALARAAVENIRELSAEGSRHEDIVWAAGCVGAESEVSNLRLLLAAKFDYDLRLRQIKSACAKAGFRDTVGGPVRLHEFINFSQQGEGWILLNGKRLETGV